jgi:hypothetical protein
LLLVKSWTWTSSPTTILYGESAIVASNTTRGTWAF